MDKFQPGLPVPEGVPNGQVRPTRSLLEALAYVADMSRRSAWPENYRWTAIWWRLHALLSAAPMRYARYQQALYRDAQARPEHFAAKPVNVTDCQWSGLAVACSTSVIRRAGIVNR